MSVSQSVRQTVAPIILSDLLVYFIIDTSLVPVTLVLVVCNAIKNFIRQAAVLI